MSRLDDALKRFGAALDRLDGAVDARLSNGDAPAGLAAELSALKDERARLVARIAGLEAESRNLAGLTEEVEDRLDGTIAEIREVLGRN
jgi:predicted  nucleic acid-binding Zn-ribbon protein